MHTTTLLPLQLFLRQLQCEVIRNELLPQDATSAATQDILVSTSTSTIAIILYADSTPPSPSGKDGLDSALSGPCYSPPATLITDVSGGDEGPKKGLQEQVSQLIPDLHQPFLRENTEGDRLL